MDEKIKEEIMRLHNCCEKHAKDIILQFDLSTNEKLESYIHLMSDLIMKNTMEGSHVPASTL